MAIRRAMTVAADNGFQDIVLASDCLSAIQHIKSPVQDRSDVGSVIADIKKLATEFNSCSFRQFDRTMNVAAHTLACNCEHLACNIFSLYLRIASGLYYVLIFIDQ
jgi:hypothetical protein